MLTIRLSSLTLLLFSCVSSLPAIAALVTTEVTVRFKIASNYMIVVPVTINGSGPYDFVLDTGSNNTMLDQKLADELALPHGGETAVLRPRSSMSSATVYADSFSIAGATVAGKDLVLVTSADLRGLPRKVRGVLGEDFLQNFDVLIDYSHLVIQLESGLSSIAEMLRGEHLPIQLNGSLRGEPTLRRLIVVGHIRDLGVKSLSLLLDSGVNNLTLFRENLGVGSKRQTFIDVSNGSAPSILIVKTQAIRTLNLGKNEINDLTVVALACQPESDADGMIPTSLFHSIFISHQRRFVILNPFFPRQPKASSN